MRQERGAGRRRWFESDGLDVVVWLGTGDAITGFQLCYDLGRGEHALTWRPESGFAHHAVDDGESTPLKNETPILIPDRTVPWDQIVRMFEERCSTLEPRLRRLIAEKLAVKADDSRGY